MNYNDLNNLISEDIMSEEEDRDVPDDHSVFNSHAVDNGDNLNSDSLSKSVLSTPVEEDTVCSNLPFVSYKSDSSQDSDSLPEYHIIEVPKQNTNSVEKNTISNRNDLFTSVNEVGKKSESNTSRPLKLPSQAILLSQPNILLSSQKNEDYSVLENEINDSLLDMLQGKIKENLPKAVENYKTEDRQDESLKFITIFPAKNLGKTINLMVKGKTCRSKQPLDPMEMQIVSRIVNQENMFGTKSAFYKNVYYDPETDTNIRYEVRRKLLTKQSSRPNDKIYLKNKGKLNPCLLVRDGKMKTTGSAESQLIRNKVGTTRLGRISRQPRHVMGDYQRIKYLSSADNEADENENISDYSDCDIDGDLNALDGDGIEFKNRDYYGRLERNKQQSASVSICPICSKGFEDYRSMTIHFQKYPTHKNNELVQQFLKNRKDTISYKIQKCDEQLMSMESKCYGKCNPLQNTVVNKRNNSKGKISQRLRSPATYMKELLSCFKAEEVAKYAGPVVAETLNSWEYLLMRGKKLKSTNGTLLLSILKELKVILAQVQAISSHVLEPLTNENQSSPNKLTIGPQDVLQHVLRVSPGTYVISDSKSSLSAPSTEKQKILVPKVNSSKPQKIVQSTNRTTAKLYDAAVAECLRGESSDMDSNVVEASTKIDPNRQSVGVVIYNDGVTLDESSTNEVPIFTNNNVLLSSQLMRPQATHSQSSDGVDSQLVLDFDVFNQSDFNNHQLASDVSMPTSTSVFESNTTKRDPSHINSVAPSLAVALVNETKKQNTETDSPLDFALIE